MKEKYFDLLKQWCDALLKYQIRGTGSKEFDGGIMCPSCKMIHGRCHDAIYPMLYMADATGDAKYLDSAKALFDWSENMLCDDGSYYNDAHSTWNGITVFAAMSLCEALRHHAHLLSPATNARWIARLRTISDWLYTTLNMSFKTNVNYHATCAGAMAMLGNFFDDDRYRAHAKEMAYSCLSYISENGLLTGEGHPINEVTPRGCRPIDIGYNVEESMPSLLRYAMESGDAQAYKTVVSSLRSHLEFTLPDGALDNSFGTRCFKWTYWGSRTSDGCQPAYAVLGGSANPDGPDPVFAEAALRNLELYAACTHDGLLHGGPQYHLHGEKPCVHHTFCHAKALATALDSGLVDLPRASLPSDAPTPLRYYAELDTYRIAMNGFRADVTGYDSNYMKGGHTSGGSLSLLWHTRTGPILLTGAVDYSLEEPHNMQLSLNKATHRSLAPRVEMVVDGVRYSQIYDFNSDIRTELQDGVCRITADSSLVDAYRRFPARRVNCTLDYAFGESSVSIHGRVSPASGCNARYVLPVIAAEHDKTLLDDNAFHISRKDVALEIKASRLKPVSDKIFNLCGGFEAYELVIETDESGCFYVEIAVV